MSDTVDEPAVSEPPAQGQPHRLSRRGVLLAWEQQARQRQLAVLSGGCVRADRHIEDIRI